MSEREVLLSVEEQSFIQKLVVEHLEYYRVLAGSQKCSPGNQEKHKLLETLWTKLNS